MCIWLIVLTFSLIFNRSIPGLQVVVKNPGESDYYKGDVVFKNNIKDMNSQLKEEIKDLKDGYVAIEEKARGDIGMIKEGEEFYLITGPRPDPETKTND